VTTPTPLPRAEFPVVEQYRYFDHAGVAPVPRVAADAMRAWLARVEHQGKVDYEELEAAVEATRSSAARIMGVPADDVAFVKNTTEGLGFVASGLTWHPGDRVVVPDHEFPSTIYPWLALRDLGVRVDLVPTEGEGRAVTVDAFARAIADGPPPRVVAASWVQFGRGWRVDLAALASVAHDAGALLCADVIQGLGVIPVELAAWGVDFAMADGHKWLCAPEGQGVFYAAPPAAEQLRPLEPGWASVDHRQEWDNLELVWDRTARRFEGGTANTGGAIALGASIDLLLDAGIDAIWSHVDALCDRLVSQLSSVEHVHVLTDRSGDGGSGIVTFAVDGIDAERVVEELTAQRFVCSARGGGTRIAPHGYNDDDEIDALVASVASLVATTR